jgi:hypothetical protein
LGDCNISGVVANVACDGEEIFYVELNFDFENIGNEGFTVQGNGQNYGNFEYANVPITLGPFEAGTGLGWKFVVIDNQVDDCQNFVEVGEVNCSGGTNCGITNTFIEYLDCNGDGNFFIQVDVEVANPAAATFTIVGNGQNYGTFEYGQSFYQIGPFEGNTSEVYELILPIRRTEIAKRRSFLNP